MEIVDLPVALIYPHAEARAVDKQKVDRIAESVSSGGLMNPITVRAAMKVRNGAKAPAWEIIAGNHRYEACAVRLRWETVPCVVMEADDLLAALLTIDENLCRAELTPAQAAYQTARRKEIYETLHPEAKAQVRQANARWNADDNLSPAFTDATAKATGKTIREVQRNAARGEALGETLKIVAGTSLDKGVELDALAQLPPEQREEIVARAQRGEKVSARAVKLADEPLNDFEAKEKQVAALMSAWNKAGLEAREEFLGRIDRPLMDRRFG